MPLTEIDDDGDGQSECEGDCDDADVNNFDGNTEVCDGADNDCDTIVPLTEIDNDTDGQTECEGDCDDADISNYDGNSEVCDGQDNDCDGLLGGDEIDDDGDGQTECDGDCDDGDITNFLGNAEICDGEDNDCNGATFALDTFVAPDALDVETADTFTLANVLTPLSAIVVDSIEVLLEAPEGKVIDLVLYEGSALAGNYTAVASGSVTVDLASAGVPTWFNSGTLGYTLDPARFYVYGATWDSPGGDVGYFSSSVRTAIPSPAGDLEGLGSGEFYLPTALIYTLPPTSVRYTGAVALITQGDETDNDFDGALSCEDCNDATAEAVPGGVEVCDAFDNDCDGLTNDGASFEPIVVGGGAGTAIPDGLGADTAGPPVVVTADVTATEPVADLDVFIDITHTFVDDLEITLTGPDGTVVSLWNRETDSDFPGADDIRAAIFDDEALDLAIDAEDADSPFTQRWVPRDSLGALEGADPSGTWTLTITDWYNNDVGTLDGWELHFATDGPGNTDNCPALDCLSALQADPALDSGLYWIDPDGLGGQQARCDMVEDDGGWTLLLKSSGDSTLGYDASLWTDFSLLNADDETLDPDNAKYEAFTSLPLYELRGCFPDQGDHCIFGDELGYGTAQELFSGGYTQIGSGHDGQLYSGWSTQPNCQEFGVNTPYQYQRVRFGLTANQENDCNTNDTAVGFGVGPHNTTGASYGSGTKCLSSQCSLGNTDAGFSGLLWSR